AISYSKVRTLTRLATPDNEAELVDLASGVPAGELRRSLALWLKARMSPKEFEDHQHSRRSVTWRTEADGMIRFTLRLEPLIAATLISLLAKIVMRPKPRPATSESWPTAAQQHADAFNEVLSEGAGAVDTEVVVHVRADGATLADGTPIADTVVERIAPKSFIRALIHDANGKPVDASNRRRHPTTRQKRVINERDSHTCVDCGRSDLLKPRGVSLAKTKCVDLSSLLAPISGSEDRSWLIHSAQAHGNGPILEDQLLADSELMAAIDSHRSIRRTVEIINTDRSVCARLAGE
ncbi:MAG: DUF222 domain-containing protein, partial [Actinomycetia bacterium]|nr:DUF222 domain-containing protein [Actinomycetes bacterium]